MRAVGFSEIKNRTELKKILQESISNSTNSDSLVYKDVHYVEFIKMVSDEIGLAISGEYDENGKFLYNYYYPFLKGSQISSREYVFIERHISKASYLGMIEDVKVGISIIFYLQNYFDYINTDNKNIPRSEQRKKISSVRFAGLSTRGRVLFPIKKNEMQKVTQVRKNNKKHRLIMDAREGNEEAMDSLSIEDIETYRIVSEKIKNTDIYSLVETTFMPEGLESDLYTFIGIIMDYKKVTNYITQEEIYIIKINCNDIKLDVAINEKDLEGELKIGRRFKGNIWLQGTVERIN